MENWIRNIHLYILNYIVNLINEWFFVYHVFMNTNEMCEKTSVIINTMIIHVKNQA